MLLLVRYDLDKLSPRSLGDPLPRLAEPRLECCQRRQLTAMNVSCSSDACVYRFSQSFSCSSIRRWVISLPRRGQGQRHAGIRLWRGL